MSDLLFEWVDHTKKKLTVVDLSSAFAIETVRNELVQWPEQQARAGFVKTDQYTWTVELKVYAIGGGVITLRAESQSHSKDNHPALKMAEQLLSRWRTLKQWQARGYYGIQG